MNGEQLPMSMLRRWMTSSATLLIGLAVVANFVGSARAEWPLRSKQVVYLAQAPSTGTGQAPVFYTAQAPVSYTVLSPSSHHSRAQVFYAAQAPVSYTGQAPSSVGVTGSAPTTYNSTTGSAPATGNAPAEGGIRISLAVRSALHADLVSYYHSADSGDTRLEKIKAVRDRAKEEYLALIEGEDNEELNAAEQQDLRTLVDWVISGGTAASQRTYYAPLAPAPASGFNGGNSIGAGSVTGPAGQPTTIWVPVYAHPQKPVHKLLHIP